MNAWKHSHPSFTSLCLFQVSFFGKFHSIIQYTDICDFVLTRLLGEKREGASFLPSPPTIRLGVPATSQTAPFSFEASTISAGSSTGVFDLLRNIRHPINLELFDTDGSDVKPCPRASSPHDLEKIKEFINANLKNGVISKSESPWSFQCQTTMSLSRMHTLCLKSTSLSFPPPGFRLLADPPPTLSSEFSHYQKSIPWFSNTVVLPTDPIQNHDRFSGPQRKVHQFSWRKRKEASPSFDA